MLGNAANTNKGKVKQIARATDMIEISLNERESGLFEAAEFAARVLAFREAYKVRVEEEVNVKAMVVMPCQREPIRSQPGLTVRDP